ncbi:MAG: phosphoglycerate kinase [Nanoarchaeota archaeon]|nr:phosphoglycerate kinase [Nanoarchaeota archaeon]
MFEYFTLDNFDVTNKVVFLRVDLDSLLVNGRVSYSEKFQRTCKTIRELVQKKAKVVILIKQNLYNFEKKSLQDYHLKLIEQEISSKILFSKSISQTSSSNLFSTKISKLKPAQVLLCENINLFDSKELVEAIKLAQLYIIDSFSEMSNKLDISISTDLLEKIQIPIIVGRSLEREILHLEKLKFLFNSTNTSSSNSLSNLSNKNQKNQVVYVFGGVKLKEQIEHISYLLEENLVQKILLAGLIGELALYIKGVPLGKKSQYFSNIEENNDDLLGKIDIYNSNLDGNDIKLFRTLFGKYESKFVIPKDVCVYSSKDKRVEISIEDLKENEEFQELVLKEEISDIGMKTINEFENYLIKSKVIVVKGVMGRFELKEFEKGSKELLQIISKLKKQKFLLGGHTIAAAKMFNILKKFNYVSFGGNVIFHIIQKKKIEGFELLKLNYKNITRSSKSDDNVDVDVKSQKKYYDFVSLGSNTLDIKVDVPEKFSQIEMGEKIKIKEGFKISNGGGGVNVSIALTKLHSKVGYLGKISNEFKEILEKTLKNNKIGLIPSKETKKQVAKSILMQTKDGDRVIFTFRGQNDFLEFEDFDNSIISSNNFYFTALNGKSMQTQIKFARKLKRTNKNALICYNPSMYLIKEEKRNLDKLISLCDIIIFNFDEAKELTGDRDISSCLRSMYSKGAKLIVITDGSNGSYAYNGEEEYYQKSKEPRAVVDTTGAGDCFAGTFFYFYAKRYGIKAALQYASWNASALITKNGTQNGLLTFNELTKIKRA